MTIIVIATRATVAKILVQGVEDLEMRRQDETTQTTESLRTARILRRVLETEETCCYTDSSEKLWGNAGVKNSQMNKSKITKQQKYRVER